MSTRTGKKKVVQRQICRSESVNQDKKVMMPLTSKPMVPLIWRSIKEVKTTKPIQKNYAHITTLSPAQETEDPGQKSLVKIRSAKILHQTHPN